MYKHAPKFRRTDRDNPDPSDVRDAAGIDPRGTPEFVREVKFAVRKGGKETKNSSFRRAVFARVATASASYSAIAWRCTAVQLHRFGIYFCD
jgi:hypothetical protein